MHISLVGVAGCCLEPWPKGHATGTTHPTPNATSEQPVNLDLSATLREQPYLPIASSYPYFRQSVSLYTIFWLAKYK
ncbi:MAG: hypothetical protein F6K50_42160 [Moorea sp. SIO3I7]|uniref:hypothetical protein n=1 Tax=Moorena sp. SIO3I8 TaxID=2607833 RepID=UPI0013C298F4|nr:hypothetical protein [Moorena sp. SIO3I8]NEO01761.1 hypothetical protein [Moorena sp. SIO3I7]NEO04073.1 hypothetical protein [Moorena sp. SIO3I8]